MVAKRRPQKTHRKRLIPYGHQFVEADDRRAVMEVLKSDWLTQGPNVQAFEDALARSCQAVYAAVFSSGTAALHAAYYAAGFQEGDEFITSPLTFAATCNAGLWLGAKPVFADINPQTGNIDPRAVKEKITKQTKAIVAIDYAGLPAELDELKKIATRNKALLIEDACHALGAVYKGRRIGSISDMSVFSFHPVKSITTGEGGAVATNRYSFYQKMIAFRSHGIVKGRMMDLGLNYRLTDIQAALGISQLRKLSRFLVLRSQVATYYHRELSSIPDLILPEESHGMRSAWHLYVIRLAGRHAKKRTEIFTKLRKAGIGVQVHYIPVYLHPYYQTLGYRKGLCPNAECFSAAAISLPMFPGITKTSLAYVVSTLKSLLV